MLWWILSIVFCIYFYNYVIKPHLFWKEKNVEYKTPLPIIGNMGPNLFRQRTFIDLFCDLYNEYDGKYYGIYQFLRPCIMLKDIELIKQITIKDFEYFPNHSTLVDEQVEPMAGKNLFNLKGKVFICV